MVANENITFVILDKEHDDLQIGGKSAITLGMKNLMKTTHNMNAVQTNQGSFAGSDMATYLNETLFNTLPEGWRNIIKQLLNKIQKVESQRQLLPNLINCGYFLLQSLVELIDMLVLPEKYIHIMQPQHLL